MSKEFESELDKEILKAIATIIRNVKKQRNKT